MVHRNQCEQYATALVVTETFLEGLDDSPVHWLDMGYICQSFAWLVHLFLGTTLSLSIIFWFSLVLDDLQELMKLLFDEEKLVLFLNSIPVANFPSTVSCDLEP